MSRLDAYLDNLERHGARTLTLTSGQPVTLEVQGELLRLRKRCTADEILTLVQEAMDAETRRTFVVDGSARFAYRSQSAGPVTVQVQKRGGGITCVVERAPGTRESS